MAKTIQRPTDLHAPGALEQLFAYNRQQYGGWVMELENDGGETPPPANPDEQTDGDQQPPSEAPPEAPSNEWKPPASQSDLDRLINEARAKERKKFPDYDALKTKATEFDTVNQTLDTLKNALITQALDVAAAGTTLEAVHLRNSLDLSKVAVGDDGTVSGLDEAVAAFLTQYPRYVREDKPDSNPGVGPRDAGPKTPPPTDIDTQIADLEEKGELAAARLLKLRKVQQKSS